MNITDTSESQPLQEITLLLYINEKLSLAKASKLAQIDRMSFQVLLAEHHIPIHYTITDFDADLDTLQHFEQLEKGGI